MPAAAENQQQQHVQVPDAVRAILRPAEDLTVSRWVERHRRLHDKDAAEPGPFSFEKIPYMVEPTDAFADPSVGSIVLIKASRCSGTELINNLWAYSIDARPMPCIYVLPRKEDVEEEFTGRLKRIVEASPRLAAHVPGGNWATADQITLDTMNTVSAAATVPGAFIRRTSGLNLFDEVDNCAEEAMRSRLGDVWTLLQERLTTFGYRGKQVGVSTPTYTHAAGWQAWLVSDRRRFFCPCPRCGHYQVLRFEQVKLSPEHADERDPERVEHHLGGLARYQCENPACAAMLPEGDKLWMTQRGVWVPEGQQVAARLQVTSRDLVELAHFRAGEARYTPPLAGDPPVTRKRGYWVDAAVSPWRTFSAFLAKFFATKDEPAKYKVFWTHWRALPWQEAAQSTSADDLRTKVELGHPPDLVPDRAVVLLAGVDVQLHWVYYSLWAFGPGEESWLVREGTLETLEDAYATAFLSEYPYADGNGALRCAAMAVDSGYRTSDVYDFWRAHPAEVVVVKGQETLSGGEKVRPALVEYHPTGKRAPHSVKIWHVNTGFFKEKLHNLLKKPAGGPGTLHLHRQTSQAYLDQVTAEHYVYRRPKKKARGRWVWEPKAEGKANHYGDTTVYAYALADIKNCRGLPTRESIEARATRAAVARPAPTGLTTPDGRPFLVSQRK